MGEIERRLRTALDELEATGGPLDAYTFAEVLVPFTAQLFVRGIDFPGRFKARWAPMLEASRTHNTEGPAESLLSDSNVNAARF